MGYTSLLVKTGQTTKYVDNDDGDLEKGATRSFTVLDTGQYSGTTNITMAGNTEAHPNECVLDNATGLMWSRRLSFGVGANPWGKGTYGSMPWTTDGDGNGIFAYVAAANTATLSGYSDWRIPNIVELVSIYEAETLTPNATAFPNYSASPWSSTTYNPTDNALYYFAFADKTNNSSFYAWLVRGAPTAPPVGVNTLRGLLGAGY